MAEKPGDGPLVAFVALGPPRRPEPESIVASFRKRCPDGPPASDPSHKDNSIIFHLGDAVAAISLIPAPIPWPDLEGPCATAWWWPEATAQMKKNNSHMIVALLSGSGSPIERHIQLTHLVAAVAEHTHLRSVSTGEPGRSSMIRLRSRNKRLTCRRTTWRRSCGSTCAWSKTTTVRFATSRPA